MPPRRSRRRIEREALGYLDRLLETNSARLKNDLVEQVRDSRARLESEIRAQLREAVVTAERALTRARMQLAAGRDSVAETLRRLEALRFEVEALVSS